MERVEIRTPAFTDLVDTVAQFETFRVADRLYSADLLIPQLTIRLKDLLTEAATCGAHILYWGLEAARAKRHYESAEAAYRTWRDRTWQQLKTGGNPENKPPTDSWCEKQYRTLPEYGEWNKRRADAQEGADCAQAVLEAFRAKAQLIKVQEQLLRDESGGASYYVVEERPANVPRQPQ